MVLVLVMCVVLVLPLQLVSLRFIGVLFGCVVSSVFWSRRIALSCGLRSGEGGVVRVLW